MLSFERVLEAFREHLTEDTGVEVVPTRHGCTFLTWDDRRENWDTAEICLTPEALLDRLTGAVESYPPFGWNTGSNRRRAQSLCRGCRAIPEAVP